MKLSVSSEHICVEIRPALTNYDELKFPFHSNIKSCTFGCLDYFKYHKRTIFNKIMYCIVKIKHEIYLIENCDLIIILIIKY